MEVCKLLLKETVAAAAQLRQQMEAAGETADSFAPMNVVTIQVGVQGRPCCWGALVGCLKAFVCVCFAVPSTTHSC